MSLFERVSRAVGFTLPRRVINQLVIVLLIVSLGSAIALLPLRLVGVALAGSSIAMVTLLYPKVALYLLIPAIPFSSLMQVSIGGANIGPMEGLLGLMLLSWLLKMSTRQAIVIPHPPLLGPWLLFLATIGLSWLTTLSLKASFVETLKWLEMLALYLFIYANFAPEDRQRLTLLLLFSGLAQAGLGLYQFMFKVGPPGFLLFDGRFLRAFGTFRQPNPYAGYLGLVLPLALALSLWGIEQVGKVKFTLRHLIVSKVSALGLTCLAWVALGTMLGALFASQSRGAWLAFLLAATTTILLKGGKWAVALIITMIAGALLIALGALALLPPTITQRFSDAVPFLVVADIARVPLTDANFAILERLAHWQAAQAMWRDNLWFGVGFGNYEVVYPAYAVGRWIDPLGHAHNYLLNIGAEAGFTGLLGYLIFWGAVLVFAIRTLMQTPANSLDRALLAGCVGAIVHLHFHNLLDNLYVQGMYLHITVLFSLIAGISTRDGAPHVNNHGRVEQRQQSQRSQTLHQI